MNFSRQALLGIGMIIGGSVMLYAMVQQIGATDNTVDTPAMVETASTEPVAATPLTTDIETEKRLLAQKQKERAMRVAEQERRAKQFLAEQESAEAKALAKSRAENEQYVENTTPAVIETTQQVDKSKNTQNVLAAPVVQPRADRSTTSNNTTTITAKTTDTQAEQEAIKVAEERKQLATKKQAEAQKKAADKQRAEQKVAEKKVAEKKAQAIETAKPSAPSSPSEYKVKSGDGLIKLAKQYNVPVAVLAQANNTTTSAALQLGQTITIPSRQQVARLEREAVEAERKHEQEKIQAQTKRNAQQRLVEARKEVKETDAKGNFGVQVSLATDEAAAQRVVKKFKDAGYQVTTSNTSRGVRVVVGPERGKVAALALKDKINNDPKVETSGAWVKFW